MEKRERIQKLLTELDGYVCDVNVNEIADHISSESLQNWSGAWREAIRMVIKDIEREVLE